MDGQTEAVNKCLETYLRCFTSEKQHLWVQWLPLAKWWYNTNYHATTKMTPYEAIYGQLSPSPTSYLKGCSKSTSSGSTPTTARNHARPS